jgi:GntR family transcriptional regulator
MLLQIDNHGGGPIYRQIVDQIRRQIMTGELGEGEQLATVRELASQVKVNPMTVSKAYALLEGEGLLERRRGIGLFVAQIGREIKEQTSARLLDEVLSKAAAAAVQMGISEEEAREAFQKLYREYGRKKKDYLDTD